MTVLPEHSVANHNANLNQVPITMSSSSNIGNPVAGHWLED
jgi:hypothetical protein